MIISGVDIQQKLTKKQVGFVKDYVKTGNGTLAVMNNYAAKNNIVAKSIATENLTKPYIKAAIQSITDSIPDELLLERHLELLNKIDVLSGQLDAQVVLRALDMAYKLKGHYAPEKTLSMVVEVNEEDKQRIKDAIRNIAIGDN